MKQQQNFQVESPSTLLPFLREKLAGKPAGKVKSILEHGLVSVDGKATTKYNAPLKPGQTVTIGAYVPEPPANALAASHPPILYEDRELLVIDKPAGLLTISTGSKEPGGHRLPADDRLCPTEEPGKPDLRRPPAGSGYLGSGGFRQESGDEGRLAGQLGQAGPVPGLLRHCGGKDGGAGGPAGGLAQGDQHPHRLSQPPGGRRERGRDQLPAACGATGITPTSGSGWRLERKDQIRVQLSELGHPVTGDKKYGAKRDPLKRLGLHAWKLELTHPFTGKRLDLIAEPPQKFADFLK